MKQTTPHFLTPGDTIGISATARFARPEMIETAKSVLEGAGFKVYYEPGILTSTTSWPAPLKSE